MCNFLNCSYVPVSALEKRHKMANKAHNYAGNNGPLGLITRYMYLLGLITSHGQINNFLVNYVIKLLGNS